MDSNSGGEQRKKWVALLSTVDFFTTFNPEDLDALFSFGEVKRFPANEYIIKQGSKETSIFFVLQGRGQIIKSAPSGKKKGKISTVKAGDCIGEMALWLEGVRTASVLATQDCYVFVLGKEDLERMNLELQNKMLKRLAHSMALKIQEGADLLAEVL